MKHITALVALIGAVSAATIPRVGSQLSTRETPQDLQDLKGLSDDMILIEIPDDGGDDDESLDAALNEASQTADGNPAAAPAQTPQPAQKREPLRFNRKNRPADGDNDSSGGSSAGSFGKDVAADVVSEGIVTGGIEAANAVAKRAPLRFGGRKKTSSNNDGNNGNNGNGSAAGDFGKDVAAGVVSEGIVAGGIEAANAVAKRTPLRFGGRKKTSSNDDGNNGNNGNGNGGSAAGDFGKDVAAGVVSEGIVAGGIEAANAVAKRVPVKFGRKKTSSNDNGDGGSRGGAAGEFGKDVAAGVAADGLVVAGTEAVNAVAKRQLGDSTFRNLDRFKTPGGGGGLRTPTLFKPTVFPGGNRVETRDPKRFGGSSSKSNSGSGGDSKTDSKTDDSDNNSNGGSDGASKFGSIGSGIGGLLKGGAAVATTTQEFTEEEPAASGAATPAVAKRDPFFGGLIRLLGKIGRGALKEGAKEGAQAAAENAGSDDSGDSQKRSVAIIRLGSTEGTPVEKREPSPRGAGRLFGALLRGGKDVAADVATDAAGSAAGSAVANNQKRSETYGTAPIRRSPASSGTKLGKQFGKAIRESQKSGASEAMARHGMLASLAAGLVVAMAFGTL